MGVEELKAKIVPVRASFLRPCTTPFTCETHVTHPTYDETLNSQEITDIDDPPPGHVYMAFLDDQPFRLAYISPSNDKGLYRSASVAYVARPDNPWIIRVTSEYGNVSTCGYEYTQFDGFTHIQVPDFWLTGKSDPLKDFLLVMGNYLHDHLMFHQVDPPSAVADYAEWSEESP